MQMQREKYLRKVCLASDVYATCLQHALTTEKQEIMGLLIGEVDEENFISHISACVILHRSDKQPDRVEISPEQLCLASSQAETLAADLNRPMRVLGWYHSHPHITVWPSHVDLRTQAMYQIMDPLFIGLIFSVYESNQNARNNRIQLTCFQAMQVNDEYERREVELVIENCALHDYNLKEISNLSNILVQEEEAIHGLNDNNGEDKLAKLHNEAFKTLALVQIVSKVTLPLYEDLSERLKISKARVEELKKLKQRLQKTKR